MSTTTITMAMMMIRKNSLLLKPLELSLEQKLCVKVLLVTGNTLTMVNFMALKLINTTKGKRCYKIEVMIAAILFV